jgi:hypothetical protein
VDENFRLTFRFEGKEDLRLPKALATTPGSDPAEARG